jgi:hypothetical protein
MVGLAMFEEVKIVAEECIDKPAVYKEVALEPF